MINIGAISYSIGAGLFFVLTLLLLTGWRGRLQGALLVIAAGISTIWASVLAFSSAVELSPIGIIGLLEILRDAAWFAFLLNILGYATLDLTVSRYNRHLAGFVVISVSVGLAVYLVVSLSPDARMLKDRSCMTMLILCHLLLAVVGLVLIEQLFRNTRTHYRWAIKFLCLGLGGIFAYDFFLYSDALLFNQIEKDLWDARGIVNAFVVPLIAVSAARNPLWSVEIFVSRGIVFHTAALLGAGLYLVLVAIAGYYIRFFGGSWGSALQAMFLFGAVVLLLLLMFSGQVRARTKVFLTKHFFKNKYEYREEWLRFTHTLSNSEHNVKLRENIIHAVAELVESPGGVMWVRQDRDLFYPVASWNATPPELSVESVQSSLVRFLQKDGWVVYLDEYDTRPEQYLDLMLPEWLLGMQHAWLVVPLMQRDELLGFIVLSRSSTKTHLDWEDSDLLKTVGRQAASYLALLKVTEALADARQFEAFNRLSSYVVHDLKNISAQLALVVSNAKKHKHNPDFMQDAMNTVENVTAKMNRLLTQLRKGRLKETKREVVNLKAILRKVIDARTDRKPVPTLECLDGGLIVTTDPERLADIMENIVQNAQEATAPDGRVMVRTFRLVDNIVIEIQDTGCGMDKQFIAERLFRPFDTTKGKGGMGIGVYESREFVLACGGDMQVESKPNKGTTFRIKFPLKSSVGDPSLGESYAEMAS